MGRQLSVAGKRVKPVVLRVVEKDDQGRPLLLRRYFEKDKNIALSEDAEANEFMIVFGDVRCW